MPNREPEPVHQNNNVGQCILKLRIHQNSIVGGHSCWRTRGNATVFKARAPLVRFVAYLLYNLCKKSTANRTSGVDVDCRSLDTDPQSLIHSACTCSALPLSTFWARAVLGKNSWGPGPSSFGRQPRLSEIRPTIEPITSTSSRNTVSNNVQY